MDQTSTEIACIVLAGGASTRMGYDKRRLQLWGAHGPMLLPHIVNQLIPRYAERIVVLNDPDAWADLPARLITDHIQAAGPLAGLAAGLAAMQAERALVLACDMPLVRSELIDALANTTASCDAVVPLTVPGGPRILGAGSHDATQRDQLLPEPLLAMYHRRCLPIIQTCLAQGQRRMSSLLEQLVVHYMPPAEWQRYDPSGQSFLNLNQPRDIVIMQGMLDGDNRATQ